ncbi:MAG: filamentous hemagglutinin N-terminal domain-containing protein, partial [Alphaproteobacteria bacterium]|nr:filamentous hemagglutinin N-terminal domain-containing protein [Alphaproteobacteria bacterium]
MRTTTAATLSGASARHARRRASRREGNRRDFGALACALLFAIGTTLPAYAGSLLPTGGNVTSGTASINQSGATLNINQASQNAIINWQSFSVGRQNTVNFNQPGASSATLNRVTGTTPSWIAGTITAPGTVLLVNPNGIAITRHGTVNVGSFAASTLDIKDQDFLSGRYSFSGNGASAHVRNSGHINASDGGFVALLGGGVSNSGVITAKLGKVGLGSGEMATLDLAGDGFLSVAVPTAQLGNIRDGHGHALVSNKGRINANGGTVYPSAATAAGLLRNAVNVPGSINARSVGTRNGRIVIGGGAGGIVRVSGRLNANASRRHPGNGGRIAISGAKVRIRGTVTANGLNGGTISAIGDSDLKVSGTIAATGSDGVGGRIDLTAANVRLLGALIDASGASGGGLVRIGGTFQGGNGDPNDPLYQSYIGRFGDLPALTPAQIVVIDGGSRIVVAATRAGDAGSAIVWSQQATGFAGTIIGTGGPNGGHGGYAEVSSHGGLAYNGTAYLLAAAGAPGTLLLDPFNVIIVSGNTGTITGGQFTATADSNLGATTITNALANGNVIIST